MRPDRHVSWLGPARVVLVLTVAAGLVDAAAFLMLGGVFVANQTGNCVLLAVAIAERVTSGEGGIGVAGPLMSLGAFCAGAAIAGWLGPKVPAVSWALPGVEALALAAAAAAPGPGWARVVLVAAAMGVQSVVAARLGVPGVTTTVITGTLAVFFSRVGDPGRRRGDAGVLVLVWSLYVAAAVTGAAGARLWSFGAICWCAVALVALSAVAGRAGGTPSPA